METSTKGLVILALLLGANILVSTEGALHTPIEQRWGQGEGVYNPPAPSGTEVPGLGGLGLALGLGLPLGLVGLGGFPGFGYPSLKEDKISDIM